jgi:hypothetical protein
MPFIECHHHHGTWHHGATFQEANDLWYVLKSFSWFDTTRVMPLALWLCGTTVCIHVAHLVNFLEHVLQEALVVDASLVHSACGTIANLGRNFGY